MTELREGYDETPVSQLPIEAPPPPDLEQRVVERLLERRLIRRASVARWWLPLAASLVGLLAGWLLRSLPRVETPAVVSGSLYLLLLSDDPVAGPPESERVRIYSAWARQLKAEGRLESAKKLDEQF